MIANHRLHNFQPVEPLPLFAWLTSNPRKGGRPPRATVPVKHCRDCGAVINRSSRGRCKPCANIGLKRACPDDLLAILHAQGSHGAAKHYHASLSTVTRWRRELELKAQARLKKAAPVLRPRCFQQVPLIVKRDMSYAGQAADFLRRYGAVYRCDALGRPNAKGAFWKRNFSVLTDDEIIQSALKLRWQPDLLADLHLADEELSEMAVSALYKRDRISPATVAAMVMGDYAEAKMMGDGWVMMIGPSDANLVQRYPTCVFVKVSEVRELISSGWEPKREHLQAIEGGM